MDEPTLRDESASKPSATKVLVRRIFGGAAVGASIGLATAVVACVSLPTPSGANVGAAGFIGQAIVFLSVVIIIVSTVVGIIGAVCSENTVGPVLGTAISAPVCMFWGEPICVKMAPYAIPGFIIAAIAGMGVR